jgi:hypothetical protein
LGLSREFHVDGGEAGVFLTVSGTADMATTGAKAHLALPSLRGAEAPLFHGITGIYVVLLEQKADAYFLRVAGTF